MQRYYGWLFRLGIVAVVLAGVWWPHVSHFWIPTPDVTAGVVDGSRRSPDDGTLSALAGVVYEPGLGDADPGATLAVAEGILRGRWADGAFGVREFCWPFCVRDLARGWPTQQLRFASLVHVDVLLSAYELTRDGRFLDGAVAIIGPFAQYEQGAVFSRGYLWNDHAIAQRVLVTTRFWSHYRRSAHFDPVTGRQVLELVARSGRLLALPEHFTARTNHGIMQSLALLHVAAAFPELPDSVVFREVAVERLRMQLRYYQSEEGVVLEHSPGYHALGMTLLAALDGYRSLLPDDLAADVVARRREACRFFLDLARPDWTLPVVGNTSATPTPVRCVNLGKDGVDPSVGRPPLRIYPVSGYAVAWLPAVGSDPNADGRSQTVVAWGNFATKAHKHDDEMAVVTWLHGQTVLTGAGYWPYGHPLQPRAISWRGANAPHFDQEASRGLRSTELLATGEGEGLVALDLERVGTDMQRHLRRQVILLGGDEWLVIDYADSAGDERYSVVWTLAPQWSLAAGASERQYIASTPDWHGQLRISFASIAPIQVRALRASADPFGGYMAREMSPLSIESANSIELLAGTGTVAVSRFSAAAGTTESAPTVLDWRGPSEWALCLDGEACINKLTRRGTEVAWENGTTRAALALEPLPSSADRVAAINEAYREASARFPPWRDYYPWRRKASAWLLAAFAAQELLFLLAGRLTWSGRRIGTSTLLAGRVLSLLLWLVLGGWLVLVYLAP